MTHTAARLVRVLAPLVLAAALAACTTEGDQPGRAAPPGASPSPTSAADQAAARSSSSEGDAPNASPVRPARSPRHHARTRTADGSFGVLSGVRVGIDPGHNGGNGSATSLISRQVPNGRGAQTENCNTAGTSTNAGYAEHAFTFAVARYLASYLRAAGAKVVMTRTNDTGVGPCVDERAAILNKAHAAVAIDIHGDGSYAPGARGFAILEPAPSGINDAVVADSLRYAEFLRREFKRTAMPVSNYDGVDGFKVRPDLGGLNLTTVPQLLIECGNMRNADDAALMTSPGFQRSAAKAIMRAMRDFLRSR